MARKVKLERVARPRLPFAAMSAANRQLARCRAARSTLCATRRAATVRLPAQFIRCGFPSSSLSERLITIGTMSPSTAVPEPRATLSGMRETEPSVFLISRPSIDMEGVRGYLDSVGGSSWVDRRSHDGERNDAQLLVEFCGRACYRSWEPGLNPNVTRIREDQHEYLRNLLSSLHGSVLEHANYT